MFRLNYIRTENFKDMATAKEISAKLREEMRYCGLKQKEIAAKTNIRQQTISDYLTGKKLPALDTFANLCEAIDADPAYILCLKN